MASGQYELYRNSSIGTALTDTLDDLISDNQLEPQLAMKVIANFDKAFSEIIAEKVKSRLSFKGHLDVYRFCDDVWTFLIKDVLFKLDNQAALKADKVKIVSCTNKKAGET
ncbi:MAG: Transcription initiation factor IIA small chain (TFIIA 13.5 kDa subunit) [Chrysothrix sp. TS-e1954]|nr:MAG: Transcription initiation factor IIA small chain (TFIIA 13.5 kDa subunit) [Chrysothrix sp. TS-e1954]